MEERRQYFEEFTRECRPSAHVLESFLDFSPVRDVDFDAIPYLDKAREKLRKESAIKYAAEADERKRYVLLLIDRLPRPYNV